jgi:saccharopine dehydrogenase-like NADP-dependent oxidoreductase
VLGCGVVGEAAVQDLYEYGPFEDLVVATRNVVRAREVLGRLAGRPIRVSAEEVDVHDEAAVAGLMHGCAVAVNCVGPNHEYALRVARAAIRAKVSLVDVNDDYETAFEMFSLDSRARAAGIVIVPGLGVSPGIANVVARAAADTLDAVDEIHISRVMSAADPGGPAFSKHLLHSLSGRALTMRDGRLVEVRSLVDGWERVEFPEPVGILDVFHAGHPAPITLLRSFPGLRHASHKGSFTPAWLNDVIVSLGQLVREAPAAVLVRGRSTDPMDFAAAYLQRRCRSLSGPSRSSALRIDVHGRRRGKRRRVIFATAGRLAPSAGVAASVGAAMLAEGQVRGSGIVCPETAIDAHDFLYEIFTRRDVAKLDDWTEDEPEPVAADS